MLRKSNWNSGVVARRDMAGGPGSLPQALFPGKAHYSRQRGDAVFNAVDEDLARTAAWMGMRFCGASGQRQADVSFHMGLPLATACTISTPAGPYTANARIRSAREAGSEE